MSEVKFIHDLRDDEPEIIEQPKVEPKYRVISDNSKQVEKKNRFKEQQLAKRAKWVLSNRNVVADVMMFLAEKTHCCVCSVRLQSAHRLDACNHVICLACRTIIEKRNADSGLGAECPKCHMNGTFIEDTVLNQLNKMLPDEPEEKIEMGKIFNHIGLRQFDEAKDLIPPEARSSLLAYDVGGKVRYLLHYATRKGGCEIVEYLLNGGAGIELKEPKFGETPLLTAARAGQEEMTRLLISRKANLEARDKEGKTPLHCAANDISIATILLEAGAQKDVKDEKGNTPFDLAKSTEMKSLLSLRNESDTESEPEEKVKVKKKKVEVRRRIKVKLFDLIEHGKFNEAKDLIPANARALPLFIKTNNKREIQPLLHHAVRYGACDLASYLLAGGANIDLRNGVGDTPLFIAVRENKEECCKLLIDRRANVEATTKEKDTPLMIAVIDGYEGICKILLEKANVHAKDEDGYHAIHLAAFYNRISIAKLLIAKGARLDAKDTEGMTPRDIAKEQKHPEMEILLNF